MSNPVILTKEGLKKLEEELYYLKSVKRNEVSEKIRVAKEFGDLSENSEYNAAREEQSIMEGRITYIEEQLKNAKILDESELSNDTVSVGTLVTVYDSSYDEEEEYLIVGRTESNPAENKISDQSPIGKALIGQKLGSTVTVEAPGGNFTVEIRRIRLPE